MFEEICRKTGTIRIPTGEYSDSVPVFENHTVSYFTMTETFRNADGVQRFLRTSFSFNGFSSS